MTEQFMEDLTNEEHEALLLMSEHGIAAPLSPAAQAVLSAYHASPLIKDNLLHRYCLAAVLRATVQELKYFGITEKNILAIATELENSNV